MKNRLHFLSFALASILFASWSLSAQDYHFSEGFAENSTPVGWSVKDVSYSSSATNAANMVITEQTFCAKMKTNNGETWLQAPKVNGAGTLSFWCKVKASDLSPTVIIQSSSDGVNWDDLITNPSGLDLTNGSDFQNVVIPLDLPGELILRFYVTTAVPGTASAGALTVDDIQLTKPAVSADDVTLTSITLGESLVEGFDFNVTDYNVELILGQEYQVDATPNNPKATVDITQVANIEGSVAERTATVVVTGEDGTSTATTTIVVTMLDIYYREGFGDAATGTLSLEGWDSQSIYQSTSNVPADAPNLYPGPASMRYTGGHPTGSNTEPGWILSPKLADVGTLKFWVALQNPIGGESLTVLLLKEQADSVELAYLGDTQLSQVWQEVSIDINETDSVQVKIKAVCDVNDDADNRIYLDDLLLTRFDPTASVNSLEAGPSVAIYPNPVQETLNMTFPENSYELIEVFNITGQKVMEESLRAGQTNLNVKALNKGVYMISFSGKAGKHTSKFVKE